MTWDEHLAFFLCALLLAVVGAVLLIPLAIFVGKVIHRGATPSPPLEEAEDSGPPLTPQEREIREQLLRAATRPGKLR